MTTGAGVHTAPENPAMSNEERVENVVSTIIPVYNRGKMLREAVESVLAQTYRPIEIVIVDDGSTDDTPAVLRELAATYPEVVCARQPNAGPGAARERGRQLCRGEFIQLLDSDDLLDPRKFELHVAALRNHPEAGVAYSPTRLMREDGAFEPYPTRRTGERLDTMFPAMLQARCWETAAPLYRASLFDEAGPILPLSAEEDWEYDCRIARSGVRLAFVEEVLSTHRRHGGNISGKHSAGTLRHRAVAHTAIYGHARAAGIALDAPEMRHFARELFLLARQCGEYGLPEEASSLFTVAREASGDRGNSVEFRLFAAAAKTLGWRAVGRLSAIMDRLR